jgi:small multidrug resistance pump
MKWIYLAFGIIFEVLGTIFMKYAEGFTRLIPSVLTFVSYALCLIPLMLVFQKKYNMDASVVYAIWASMGIVLLTIIGIFWFKEHVSIVKVVSILLIILGIIGLELFD